MELGFDPGLILLAMAPVFIGCILSEAWYWHKRGVAKYSLIDTLSNTGLAALHQGADIVATLLFIKTAYAWVYQHGIHVFVMNAWNVALAFLVQDFLYYWFHRAHHRIRWMWSSHVVHHSSERLNLSTAFRQSLTYPISGMWLFWLPLAWLGCPPDLVILIVGLNLAYQFFVHTEAVGKLGWLETVFNTPSHHRVHHGRDVQYIDRNYAGILIVWDKLFGTFVAETTQPNYGIVRQVQGHNPLKLTFHEWGEMFGQVWRERELRYLWKPPEWTAGSTELRKAES